MNKVLESNNYTKLSKTLINNIHNIISRRNKSYNKISYLLHSKMNHFKFKNKKLKLSWKI